MALSQEELFKLDLYDILGLDIKCTLQEIKKAFRKKALKCHPDKNPDDPNAAQLFHQLSCALEILSDESARAAYDKVLNARKAAKIRNDQLDSRRKKLKEDLEERERKAGREPGSNFKSEEMKLKAEIERLRKEGSRLLQEEIHKVREQIKTFAYSKANLSETDDRHDKANKCLTIRWKAEKGDPDNGGYSDKVLHCLLSKYGEIAALVISPKRKGRAVVEFKTLDSTMAVLHSKIGLPENPLIIESLSGSDVPKKSTDTPGNSPLYEQKDSTTEPKKSNVFPLFTSTNNQIKADHVFSPKWSLGKSSPQGSDEMLESVVLQRLRQMERMKRAAEEKTDEK